MEIRVSLKKSKKVKKYAIDNGIFTGFEGEKNYEIYLWSLQTLLRNKYKLDVLVARERCTREVVYNYNVFRDYVIEMGISFRHYSCALDQGLFVGIKHLQREGILNKLPRN